MCTVLAARRHVMALSCKRQWSVSINKKELCSSGKPHSTCAHDARDGDGAERKQRQRKNRSAVCKGELHIIGTVPHMPRVQRYRYALILRSERGGGLAN